ncbi:hypothetical protein JCM10295v2_003548 [Rhodotorula toruloides]
MARGLQKIEAHFFGSSLFPFSSSSIEPLPPQLRQKAQAKKGAGGKSNLKARAAAFKIVCPACKLPLSDYKNFKEHFESKHPKLPLPTEESLAPPA